MSAIDVVIVGTGGSGRETYSLLKDVADQSKSPLNFKGFLSLEAPNTDLINRIGGLFLGDPSDLVERIPNACDWFFSLGIGNSNHRRSMDSVLLLQGLHQMTLIHPTVQIGPDVVIGKGGVVCANSVITTNVRIGVSSQLNIGCVVGHDAWIGDYVTLAQSVNIAGNVTIGDGATVFTAAVVLPGVIIGEGSTVGAGAVVIKDVAPNTTVVGIPAKPLV